MVIETNETLPIAQQALSELFFLLINFLSKIES